MDIQAIKLISGEELVAQLVSKPSSDSNDYIVKNPAMIHVQQAPDGRAMMGLIPAAPLCEDPKKLILTISQDHVLYLYTPNKSLIDSYYEQYSSILPASSLIQS